MSQGVLSMVRAQGTPIFYHLSGFLAEEPRLEVWRKRDQIGREIGKVAHLIRQELGFGSWEDVGDNELEEW